MRPSHRKAFAALACAASAGATMAADEQARALAAGCLACHQAAGKIEPLLDGQPRASIAGRLRAFRDGSQPGTVMPQLAKGYTDAQIEAVAGYFAEIKGP